MSEYKEFKAKDLDLAIDAACKHFKVGREKLEIEIISGGSSGIFGLVGKKQATVRARLRKLSTGKSMLESPLETPSDPPAPSRPRAGNKAPDSREAGLADKASATPDKEAAQGPDQPDQPDQADKPKRSRRSRGRRRSSKGKNEARGEDNGSEAEAAPAQAQAAPAQNGDAGQQSRLPARREKAAVPARREQAAPPAKREQARVPAKVDGDRPETPATSAQPAQALPDLSPEDLGVLVKDVVARLIRPMLPELPPLEVESEPGRIKVHIVDEEHSGLIIGHQGQTIAALQYLANRIVARKAKGNVRIHLDAGDYREKQDDNLRQLALSLADKAKSQGKMQSTRPLSSYHRRLVHLALQNDDSITTRSKGEGPMKRVLILPRRENRQQQQ